MKKTAAIFTIVVFFLFGMNLITADPGKFTLDKIKDLQLDKKGLKIPAEKLFNAPGPGIHEGIMQLGGGSATFISETGLVYTNHHVAYGSVSRMSTAENNYIRDGFLAKTLADEVRARGYQARVLKLYEDVTKNILKGVKDDWEEERRNTKIRENINKLTEKYEKKYPDLNIRINNYFDGNKYYLSGYFIIRDFRIVYVPPLDIGNYGGEVDNWMWPRHTGDFSFLRAYVGPDGKTANYSEDNIPYRPRTWLKIGADGVKEGDFVMVMGYPGRTYRYRPSYYVDYQINSQYPYQVEFRGMTIRIWEEEAAKSEANYVRYAPRIKGLANYYKNFAGKIEWARKFNLLDTMKKNEAELINYINNDRKLKEKYGTILDEIKAVYDKIKEKDPINYAINWCLNSSYINSAYNTYRYAVEQEKPADEQEYRYSKVYGDTLKMRLRGGFARRIMVEEKAYLKTALLKAADLPSNQRINTLDELLSRVEGANNEEKADNLVSNLLGNSERPDNSIVNEFFGKSKNELLNSDNPYIKIGIELVEKFSELNDIRNALFNNLPPMFRKYTAALMKFKESKGEILAPDANSTMRFNYGYVRGYNARDAVYYKPFTTLTGIMEKETGEEPFHIPDRLKEVYKNKDFGRWYVEELNDVPVAFMSNNDITGGNSGSPVLDAYGRVVGTAFDMNWEGITTDYGFLESHSRCINADIRYNLFITEKFGAGRVLEELGLK